MVAVMVIVLDAGLTKEQQLDHNNIPYGGHKAADNT